ELDPAISLDLEAAAGVLLVREEYVLDAEAAGGQVADIHLDAGQVPVAVADDEAVAGHVHRRVGEAGRGGAAEDRRDGVGAAAGVGLARVDDLEVVEAEGEVLDAGAAADLKADAAGQVPVAVGLDDQPLAFRVGREGDADGVAAGQVHGEGAGDVDD